MIKRKRLSLAPLRPFHQRSNHVRALIWGGAISATDVTPFPGQSSFQRRGCVSYVIPEERRGHWTAPGVETLLTLLRQNAPSPPRIKWHELPSSACFSFPSLLFFPYSPPPFPFASLRTQTTPYVFLSLHPLFDSFFPSL